MLLTKLLLTTLVLQVIALADAKTLYSSKPDASRRAAKECGRKADVVFIIDSSASIYPPYFRDQLSAIKRICRFFTIGQDNVRVGAITFSEFTNVEFELNDYSSQGEIRDRIDQIQFAQGNFTYTEKALAEAKRMFLRHGRPGAPRIAILLTDGKSSYHDPTIEEATKAKNEEGIIIFAIGIGKLVKESELREIASAPASMYAQWVQTYKELDSETFAESLAEKTCEVCQAADVVFAIDTSASIHPDDFLQQIAAVQKICSLLDIGPRRVRIGAFTFGELIDVRLELGVYDTVQDVNAKIGDIRFVGEQYTYTHLAIEAAEEMFSRSHSPGVPKILILLTDGDPTYLDRTMANAERAKSVNNIRIMGIGIGAKVDENKLARMSSAPAEDFMLHVTSYTELQSDSFTSLVAETTCRVIPGPKPGPTETPCDKEKTGP